MTSINNRPFVPLLLAAIAGMIGFGSHVFDNPDLIDFSSILPAPLEDLVVWLSKVLFIPLMLFFIVSICFGKRLRNRHQ